MGCFSKGKECKTKDCNKCGIKPQLRYCGEDLDCLDIKKGDRIQDVIQKLAEKSCESGEGGGYTFEENLECENGGIVIRKDEDIVYQTCYPCCGDTLIDKEYFYEEVVSFVDLSDYNEPNYFSPTGYEILEYENTKSAPMVVEVHVSYNTFMEREGAASSAAYNDVQSAIIKTDVSPIDTPQYTAGGLSAIGVINYDVVTAQTITSTTPDKVVTTPSGHEVRPILQLGSIFQTISFFKVLTLQPGEKVSLKFMNKGGEAPGRIQSAQILVKEL